MLSSCKLYMIETLCRFQFLYSCLSYSSIYSSISSQHNLFIISGIRWLLMITCSLCSVVSDLTRSLRFSLFSLFVSREFLLVISLSDSYFNTTSPVYCAIAELWFRCLFSFSFGTTSSFSIRSREGQFYLLRYSSRILF